MNASRRHHIQLQLPRHQSGAALMIMLIILVVGALTLFVNSLNNSSLQIARDKVTADALAQAKAALIGRAVSDGTSPGSLPCPDTNDDGSAELLAGPNCPSYIGRLPWKTLGLPDLRDGSGERLWYALSANFRDNAPANPVNSDSQGTLAISGSITAGNVVAIVFAPGSALTGQSRSSTQTAACTTTNSTVAESLCAANYLEGSNASLNLNTAPNTNYQAAAADSTFNDRMVYLTHDQLFDPVEKRIARELKKCLDDYAADANNTYHRYPWAVPVSDTSYPTVYSGTASTGTYATLFGRLSSTLNIAAYSSNPSTPSALSALSALQAALNAYNTSPTSTNQSNLYSAAQAVVNQSDNFSGAIGNALDTAGDYGKYFANGSASYATATGKASAAFSAFADTTMPASWPASCTVLGDPTSYFWKNSWNNLAFYQLADGYKPSTGTGAGCTPGSTCLTVNGSGNTSPGNGSYHAAVIVARQAMNVGGTLQDRTSMPMRPYSDPPTPYLEGANPHSGTTPSLTFETYNASDPGYSSVNDMVLCVDGKVNCQ